MQKTIYIHPYTKTDGTEVKGHYRVIYTDGSPTLSDEISNQSQAPWTPDEISFPSMEGNSRDDREENKDAGEYGPARMPEKGQPTSDSEPSDTDSNQDSKSKDDGGSSDIGGSIIGVLLKIGQVILQVLPKVVEVLQSIQSQNSANSVEFKLQLTDNLSNIKNAQNQLTKLETDNYKKLAQIKDKSQYLKLLDETLKLKEYNDITRSLLSRMEYYAENENYEDFSSELKEYKKCSEEFFNEPKMKSLRLVQNNNNASIKHPKSGDNKFIQTHYKNIPTKTDKIPILKNNAVSPKISAGNGNNEIFELNINHNEFSFLPDLIYNHMRQEVYFYELLIDVLYQHLRTGLHKYPNIERNILTGGIFTIQSGANNAYNLWKIATEGFEKNIDYINENGYIVNSVVELKPKLRNHIQEKLKRAFNLSDSRGLVFHSQSNLAYKIANSGILNDFIRRHSQELYKERKHLDSSMEFGKQTFDLYTSLKKVDILDAHIDTNGHFRAYIVDTYDFNKGEHWYIEWARNLQELGYLAPYYTIIILNVIPKYNYEPVIH